MTWLMVLSLLLPPVNPPVFPRGPHEPHPRSRIVYIAVRANAKTHFGSCDVTTWTSDGGYAKKTMYRTDDGYFVKALGNEWQYEELFLGED